MTDSSPRSPKSNFLSVPKSPQLQPQGPGLPHKLRKNSLMVHYKDEAQDEVAVPKALPQESSPSPDQMLTRAQLRNQLLNSIIQSKKQKEEEQKETEQSKNKRGSVSISNNKTAIASSHRPSILMFQDKNQSQNPLSPQQTVQAGSPAKKVNERNSRVDNAIKKAQNKMKIKKKDRTAQFEDRMKQFEGLSTFIDAKETIKSINPILNKKVEVNRNSSIHDGASRVNPDYEVVVNSERHKIASLINSSRNLHKKNTFGLTEYDMDGKIQPKSTRARFNSQPDLFGNLMQQANDRLIATNKVNMPTKEDTDLDEFYTNLQNDLVNGKYETVDNNFTMKLSDADRKYLAHHRKLLEYQDGGMEVSEKYYLDFKQRSNKVLGLLKRATKNIYNKVLKTPFAGTNPSAQTGRSEDDPIQNTKAQKQLKSSVRKLLMVGALGGDDFFSKKRTIGDKFSMMKKKVDKADSERKMQWANTQPDEQQYDIRTSTDHKILVFYKEFMNQLIDEADASKTDYKYVKNEVLKRINHLEDAYQKEMELLHPRDMESIKMPVDTKGHVASFGIGRVKKFSKKSLGAVLK